MPLRIENIPSHDHSCSAIIPDHFLPANENYSVKVIDIYRINQSFSNEQKEVLRKSFSSDFRHPPLIFDESQAVDFDRYLEKLGSFDWATEISYLPGVTDNIGNTAKQIIHDGLNGITKETIVRSSHLILFKNIKDKATIESILSHVVNPLIQRSSLYSREEFIRYKGLDIAVPEIKWSPSETITHIDMDMSDEELTLLGSQGIKEKNGTRRGPLGLNLDELKTIRNYFNNLRRQPTDVELETLAQTWSEHCKHKIFASPIDDITEGVYKAHIKGATEKIRTLKGSEDFCVSVFKDNSGAIVFDDQWLVTDKVETHNTPSALDPFGGSLTGILGVNRDCLGFGKGAKPILNRYGFCLASPDNNEKIYRSENKTNPVLSANFIFNGVIRGIEEGGNCSGIPTTQGFLYCHDRYRGKPLVFAGTVGIIPQKINDRESSEKKILPGDKIIVVGGRVGKDGIHGATFSSEALTEVSPTSAVQIGDPITQKMFTDVLLKEARDKGLYRCITDNGAGGLSSSVGEMAELSGGCHVHLSQVPLKYPNLLPWEIWISESQERMTLAVAPEKVDQLLELLAKRDVEATVIGEFTDTGKVIADYLGQTVLNLDIEFLHDGWPKKQLKTEKPVLKKAHEIHEIPEPDNYEELLLNILESASLRHHDFLSFQYDHEVQGTSLLKPLQGKGKVFADATALKPVHQSDKAIITSQGLTPLYTEIDAYFMATAAIDQAVSRAVAAGASINHMALLDNFCWCDSHNPSRLYQLKQSTQGCYDAAVAFQAPFISGKDSMFNDFRGYDNQNNPVTISALPTLLISTISVIDHYTQTLSIDSKFPGDLIYILGQTKDEMGGSEYYEKMGYHSNQVPQTNLETARQLYLNFEQANKRGLISSAISVSQGGLAHAILRKSIAGQFGFEIDITKIPQSGDINRADTLLFSQSTSRVLVTISPENREAFEALFDPSLCQKIGQVVEDKTICIHGFDNTPIVNTSLNKVESIFRKPFNRKKA